MQRSQTLSLLFRGALAAGALALGTGSRTALAGDEKSNKDKDDRIETHVAKRHAAVGVVAKDSINKDKKSFVLDTKHGDVTVLVGADTKFHAVGFERSDGDAKAAFAFADLKAGMRLTVQGEPAADGLHAHNLVVHPDKHELKRGDEEEKRDLVRTEGVLGNIADKALPLKAGDSFTVTPSGKAAVTFKFTADTLVRLPKGISGLANGQTVTVLTRASSSDALGIRVHKAA